MAHILAGLTLCSFVACGGGDASVSVTSSFAGSWVGTLRLVETNPIGCDDREELDVSHDVQLEGSVVAVDVGGGTMLNGSLSSSTSFSASASFASAFSPYSSTVSYSNLTDNQAKVSYSESSATLTSDVQRSCFARWSGTLEKL